MRVIVNLSGRDAASQAFMRQLAALSTTPPTPRTLSPFPLSLLEHVLQAGLRGLEAVICRAVLAIGRRHGR